jgi:peptidyl-prolyl cis-trans isomerase-like protein 2
MLFGAMPCLSYVDGGSTGPINLQLECDLVPQTCHNFLLLCEKGYYRGVKFHRLIKNFMIQGGDPTGTGRGGECAWGGKFEDEFHDRLTHGARGMLCMANAGPGTNGSQLYAIGILS